MAAGADVAAGMLELALGEQALGGGFDVGGYVSVPPILQLVESFGGGSDPGYQMAKPYLSGLDFLAFGSSSEGDRQSAKVVLGLR